MAGAWDEIPPELHPKTRIDQHTLWSIADAVREAVLIRHDFQTTLSTNAGERRLRPVPMKSKYGTRKNRTASELAQKHVELKTVVLMRINTLDNKVLMAFLSKRIEWLFPDIGSDGQGGAMRLRRPESVLDLINPLISDVDLLHVLSKLDRLIITPRGIKRAPVDRDANYF